MSLISQVGQSTFEPCIDTAMLPRNADWEAYGKQRVRCGRGRHYGHGPVGVGMQVVGPDLSKERVTRLGSGKIDSEELLRSTDAPQRVTTYGHQALALVPARCREGG